MFDYATSTVRILTHDQHGHRAHGTVLTVDDHPDSREILSLLFDSLGYTVFEASDGNEALRIVADTDLDLITTDLGLPEMDGLELVSRIRAENNDPIKIALLTAYDLNLVPQHSQSQSCLTNSEQPHFAH